MIVIANIWYHKHSPKYRVKNDTLSSVNKITEDASAETVELTANPSYTPIRKEVHPTTNYPTMYEEVDITANPSYIPFLKSEDKVNPLHSRRENENLLYSIIEGDTQGNTGDDYI